jgi:hypothetical protein
MLKHFEKLFWRMLDQVMPDGPPFFLAGVILILLVLNGVFALSRW